MYLLLSASRTSVFVAENAIKLLKYTSYVLFNNTQTANAITPSLCLAVV